MREKYYPQIGDKLYLSQRTGDEWVDMVKHPYTVIDVKKTAIVVQACKMTFPTKRYYDTMPTKIEPDPFGEMKVLHWAPTAGKWQAKRDPDDIYPEFAFFGEYEYYPYLN